MATVRHASERASMHTRDKRKNSTTQKEKGNTKKRKKDTSIKPPELSSPSCLYVNHSMPVGKPKPNAKIIPIAQVALRWRENKHKHRGAASSPFANEASLSLWPISNKEVQHTIMLLSRHCTVNRGLNRTTKTRTPNFVLENEKKKRIRNKNGQRNEEDNVPELGGWYASGEKKHTRKSNIGENGNR